MRAATNRYTIFENKRLRKINIRLFICHHPLTSKHKSLNEDKLNEPVDYIKKSIVHKTSSLMYKMSSLTF